MNLLNPVISWCITALHIYIYIFFFLINLSSYYTPNHQKSESSRNTAHVFLSLSGGWKHEKNRKYVKQQAQEVGAFSDSHLKGNLWVQFSTLGNYLQMISVYCIHKRCGCKSIWTHPSENKNVRRQREKLRAARIRADRNEGRPELMSCNIKANSGRRFVYKWM